MGGSHKMAAVLRGATRRSPRAAGGQRLLRASPRGGDAAPFFCSARWGGDEWGESPPWERDVQVSFPERSSLICCIFFFAVSYGLGLMHWHSSHLALFLCICAFCGSSDLDHNLFSCLSFIHVASEGGAFCMQSQMGLLNLVFLERRKGFGDVLWSE